MLHRHFYDETKWVLKGWLNVKPNDCNTFGDFPRGYIYLFATQDNTSKTWGGTDRYICVSQRVTERVVYPNERCLTGETNRGFMEKLVKDAEYTFTPIE